MSVLQNPDSAVAKYQVNAANNKSAQSLEQMMATANLLSRINECRALEKTDPLTGKALGDLLVDPYLMATSMLHGNASASTFDHMANHGSPYSAYENLAWYFQDPYDGWYTEEKEYWDEVKAEGTLPGAFTCTSAYQVFSQYPDFYYSVGHYLNCTSASLKYFGLSMNQVSKNTSCYQAMSYARDTPMTVKAYTDALAHYYHDLMQPITTMNQKKTAWEEAEAAYNAAVASQHEHSYTKTVVAPTATTDGYTLHTCTGCNASYKDTIVPATGSSGITDPDVDAAAKFSDVVAGEWYEQWVNDSVELGLFGGYSGSDKFGPDDALSRGMVVTLLFRAYTGRTAADTNNNVPSDFEDVEPGEWYAAAVKWAYQSGITTGISATEFAPEAPVTREQLATFIGRYAAYCQSHGNTSEVDGVDLTNMNNMPDADQVDEYARNSMAWCINNNIIGGKGDESGPKIIDPHAHATRAEMAKIITVTVRDVLRQR